MAEKQRQSVIAATDKNIEWLIERLYEASRDLQADDINPPVFVLLTKDKPDRHRVESIFFAFFHHRYGLDVDEALFKDFCSTQRVSLFNLPHIRARIMLMDL